MGQPLSRAALSLALLLIATAAKTAAEFDGETSFDAGDQDIFTAVERLEKPGLKNLAHVEQGLYRGGRPLLDQGGIQSLRDLGIKTIINLQGGDLAAFGKADDPEWSRLILKLEPGEAPSAIENETNAARAAGIEEINIPLDSLEPVTEAEAVALDRLLMRIAPANLQRPIYVHCEHGKDRTGLVIGLYRMRYDGWSREKASAEMRKMGHTGLLDELFTGNMDLRRVLHRFPNLAVARP